MPFNLNIEVKRNDDKTIDFTVTGHLPETIASTVIAIIQNYAKPHSPLEKKEEKKE